LPKGLRTCVSDGHEGDRELPVSSFYGKSDGVCRKCRRRLSKVLPGPSWGPSSIRSSRVTAELEDEETEPEEPLAWDRARYWRWLTYKRYAPDVRVLAGNPVHGDSHRVDDAEIARFANEALAELASITLTRKERVAEVAEQIAKSSPSDDNGRPWTEKQIRAVAAYRIAREDLDAALSRANLPADSLGEEDEPTGVDSRVRPQRVPLPSNVVPIRRGKA